MRRSEESIGSVDLESQKKRRQYEKYACEPEDNFWKSFLNSHHVSPGDGTQDFRLVLQDFLLSSPAGPLFLYHVFSAGLSLRRVGFVSLLFTPCPEYRGGNLAPKKVLRRYFLNELVNE